MSRLQFRHATFVVLFFLLSSIFWTWPLAIRLSSRIPHDPGDPILNAWILWWNAQRVPLTDAWWNPPFLFPLPGAIALSEHLLGQSVFTTPLQLAGATPLVAYNVSMLVSYVLSGVFAYWLVYRLTGSWLAALAGGVAFAFAPYRAGQLAHLQVLTSQWMPALLLGMHGYMETGRFRWLALFAGAWVLQALSNLYYVLFVPVLIALWLAWFVKRAPRRAMMIVLVWIGSSLLLLPVLLKYREVHSWFGFARILDEMRDFSARLTSLLSPPHLLAFWPPRAVNTPEGFLFPGLTIFVAAAAGLLSIAFHRRIREAIRERSPLIFYAAAAVIMYALALGPGGEDGGSASLLHPYTWLLPLPGYHGLRVPARFGMLGALCLSIAAALSIAMLLRRARWWRVAIACAAIVGIGIDGYMEPIPLAGPPQRLLFDLPPRAAVIELPTDDPRVSVAAMYRAIFHRHVLVNGYTGHNPYHYKILSRALRRGDPSVLYYFAQDRPLGIVVNYEADPGGDFRKMIEELPEIQPHGITGAGTLFFLPQQPPRPTWQGGSPLSASFTDEPVRVSRRLIADLGAQHTVSGIRFAMRGRYEELAERILIDASDDGRTWREVWLGWTGEFALDAALRDPQVAEVRIPLPPTAARYVRIYPAEPWLRDEITIVGNRRPALVPESKPAAPR